MVGALLRSSRETHTNKLINFSDPFPHTKTNGHSPERESWNPIKPTYTFANPARQFTSSPDKVRNKRSDRKDGNKRVSLIPIIRGDFLL